MKRYLKLSNNLLANVGLLISPSIYDYIIYSIIVVDIIEMKSKTK